MSSQISLFFKKFDSMYGEILILWKLRDELPKINKISLGKRSPTAVRAMEERSCRTIYATIRDIHDFFSGEIVEFDLDVIDLDVCTKFQRKVILSEYAIPRGYVSTYKRIANHIERPDAARAVGNALSTNPFPIIIPCHRAIKSDGSLGGYQGGIRMKYLLLEMEGIRFKNDQKALLDRVYY